MHIQPIFAALRRHKLVMWLLILEIALTCAIVCNSVFLIAQNLQRMGLPSGIAEDQLLRINGAYITDLPDAEARTETDLAALRQTPGVTQVAIVDTLPFSNHGNNTDIKLQLEQEHPTLNAGLYFGKNLLSTFGVNLVAGRAFQPDEFVSLKQALSGLEHGDAESLPHVAIITQAMADRLWPGQNALGKTFFVAKNVSLRVVGILAQLARPNGLRNGYAFSIVVPITGSMADGGNFVIRCAPQDRERVLRAAIAKLKKVDPNGVVMERGTYAQVRAEFFQSERAMAGTLVGVCLALLVVTALGIGGLASFWVAQRRKQIGIRRALGATRTDILRYFQTENFLIVSFGIVLGMTLAYGLSLFLMAHYELPRLPWFYLPVGAFALWSIGQLAVLGPARRASNVPPVVATRSV